MEFTLEYIDTAWRSRFKREREFSKIKILSQYIRRHNLTEYRIKKKGKYVVFIGQMLVTEIELRAKLKEITQKIES